MMKRLMVCFLCLLLALSAGSCSGLKDRRVKVEPETAQMKAICELAVMDCYYHNVAKYKEEEAESFLWWKKDKHFWIEYSGVVKLGIDVSQVTAEVKDTVVTITLPEAKVLNCTVDSASLSEDSFIIEKSSAKIDAEDEVKAFDEAQEILRKTASGDTALLASAQQRAQILLEDYITNIGNATGTQYTIEWIYVDSASGDSETDAEDSEIESTGAILTTK